MTSFQFQIFKLEQHKGDLLVHVYLFIGTNSQDLNKSINHQLIRSGLWQKFTSKNNNMNIINNSCGDTGNTSHNKKTELYVSAQHSHELLPLRSRSQ